MLAHGCHLLDTARYLAGEITAVRARLSERAGIRCWFVDVEFASGALGHLDLTVAVRMDWHEGFQIYGKNGSVIGKTFNPWYYKTSEVDIFRESDGATHRVLGADGHFYRRQVEGFAGRHPERDADGRRDRSTTASRRCEAWSPSPGRWKAAAASPFPTSPEAFDAARNLRQDICREPIRKSCCRRPRPPALAPSSTTWRARACLRCQITCRPTSPTPSVWRAPRPGSRSSPFRAPTT